MYIYIHTYTYVVVRGKWHVKIIKVGQRAMYMNDISYCELSLYDLCAVVAEWLR